MPNIKNKEDRLKILNECLRDPRREYTYVTLLAELNRQLAAMDKAQISERSLREDLKTLEFEFGIELDKKLMKQRPVVLRYADLSDTINKLSMDEANALRRTIDLLLQSPKPRPIQYDYIRVCLQQILKDRSLDIENPSVKFADNLDQEGRGYFVDLCGYIFDKQSLKIEYCPFNAENRVYKVSPYLLKQYNERWFLMAWDTEKEMLLTLALDRMVSIKKSTVKYVPCHVDWNDYFDEIVGVTMYKENQIDRIRLKIRAERFPYVETKPFNSSHKVVKELSNDEFVVFEINVRPNNELESLILSFGETMEVLEPAWLREKIRQRVKAQANLYKE